MKRPIIGITASIEEITGRINAFKTTSGIDYSKSVIDGGGIPFILPNHPDEEIIKEQIKVMDGLLLSGGGDLDPFLYGEDCLENVGGISPERDSFEMKILSEFLKTGKPTLGICRGLQLINVYYGGSLYQDTGYIDRKIKINHSHIKLPDLPVHHIEIEKGNLLYDIFGERARVNSSHHQMIRRLGDGLTAIAASPDGVIEAFQDKSHNFFYGVQWHPEMMAARGNENMKKIFSAFVEACR